MYVNAISIRLWGAGRRKDQSTGPDNSRKARELGGNEGNGEGAETGGSVQAT